MRSKHPTLELTRPMPTSAELAGRRRSLRVPIREPGLSKHPPPWLTAQLPGITQATRGERCRAPVQHRRESPWTMTRSPSWPERSPQPPTGPLAHSSLQQGLNGQDWRQPSGFRIQPPTYTLQNLSWAWGGEGAISAPCRPGEQVEGRSAPAVGATHSRPPGSGPARDSAQRWPPVGRG